MASACTIFKDLTQNHVKKLKDSKQDSLLPFYKYLNSAGPSCTILIVLAIRFPLSAYIPEPPQKFRSLVAKSRAPQNMVLIMFWGDLAKLGKKLTKYGRGCPAGTGWHPESRTPTPLTISVDFRNSLRSGDKNPGDLKCNICFFNFFFYFIM